MGYGLLIEEERTEKTGSVTIAHNLHERIPRFNRRVLEAFIPQKVTEQVTAVESISFRERTRCKMQYWQRFGKTLVLTLTLLAGYVDSGCPEERTMVSCLQNREFRSGVVDM